jgi:4-aminobutyrate aminotransferase-like enzyme
MIGIELVKGEKITPAGVEAEAIRDAMLRRGVLVAVGAVTETWSDSNHP